MTNAEARFNKSHIRKVYACLAVTCHLHFWQNDRDFLRATVVTRGWNGCRNKSQHRKSTLEKKILPPFQRDSNPRPFNHESGVLTTELSPPPPPPPPKKDGRRRALCSLGTRTEKSIERKKRDYCAETGKKRTACLPCLA